MKCQFTSRAQLRKHRKQAFWVKAVCTAVLLVGGFSWANKYFNQRQVAEMRQAQIFKVTSSLDNPIYDGQVGVQTNDLKFLKHDHSKYLNLSDGCHAYLVSKMTMPVSSYRRLSVSRFRVFNQGQYVVDASDILATQMDTSAREQEILHNRMLIKGQDSNDEILGDYVDGVGEVDNWQSARHLRPNQMTDLVVLSVIRK